MASRRLFRSRVLLGRAIDSVAYHFDPHFSAVPMKSWYSEDGDGRRLGETNQTPLFARWAGNVIRLLLIRYGNEASTKFTKSLSCSGFSFSQIARGIGDEKKSLTSVSRPSSFTNIPALIAR